MWNFLSFSFILNHFQSNFSNPFNKFYDNFKDLRTFLINFDDISKIFPIFEKLLCCFMSFKRYFNKFCPISNHFQSTFLCSQIFKKFQKFLQLLNNFDNTSMIFFDTLNEFCNILNFLNGYLCTLMPFQQLLSNLSIFT